jgi:hypothetical protein
LVDIGGISWINLKKMKLDLSNTASVEAISWLNCPNLEEIELSVRIRTVKKPFTKGLFRKLKTLKINNDGMD